MSASVDFQEAEYATERPLLEIKDRPIRVFAAGSVGFNVLGNNGFSAYLRADGLVASHANSVALWAGLRVGL